MKEAVAPSAKRQFQVARQVKKENEKLARKLDETENRLAKRRGYGRRIWGTKRVEREDNYAGLSKRSRPLLGGVPRGTFR